LYLSPLTVTIIVQKILNLQVNIVVLQPSGPFNLIVHSWTQRTFRNKMSSLLALVCLFMIQVEVHRVVLE